MKRGRRSFSEKMKRRDFLKKAGLVVCGFSSLGLLTAKPSVYDCLLRATAKAANSVQFKLIRIEGEEYFILVMHPRQAYLLDVIVARDKYKHDRWVERYNKWAQSQGKPSFKIIEGKFGTL